MTFFGVLIMLWSWSLWLFYIGSG